MKLRSKLRAFDAFGMSVRGSQEGVLKPPVTRSVQVFDVQGSSNVVPWRCLACDHCQ